MTEVPAIKKYNFYPPPTTTFGAWASKMRDTQSLSGQKFGQLRSLSIIEEGLNDTTIKRKCDYIPHIVYYGEYRRRIELEDKAKGVASDLGAGYLPR